ncbi:MAG TPA: SDR family oxidoreductase [Burkholderiaceae bacterium]|nr:SDR family oxidoreductase [Burkholderiaceae bacterium]
MTQRLAGRVALVFGAGSVGPGWGNGKAAAVQYAREGAKVVAVDIDGDAAAETRDIIASEGGQAIAQQCDVTHREQIAAVVTAARAEYGAIDVLHNNVGLPAMGTIETISEEAWDLAMDVNLKSVLLCCQATIPTMLEKGRGAIVNISSVAAIRYTGYPYPAYYASKAAVNHLTVAIALEYAARGIRANAIMPGLMDTPHIYRNIAGQYRTKEEMVAARNKLSPTGRMGTAWDIAKAAVFLASDDAEYITGQCLAVDGGLSCRSQ